MRISSAAPVRRRKNVEIQCTILEQVVRSWNCQPHLVRPSSECANLRVASQRHRGGKLLNRKSGERMDGHRVWRRDHSGVRDRDEREQGTDDFLQSEDGCVKLPARCVPRGLLRRQRRPQGRYAHTQRISSANSACLHDGAIHGAGRLRQLDGFCVLGRTGQRNLRALHGAPGADRQRWSQPHPVCGARRQRLRGSAVPDIRYHLAGV